MTKYLCTTLNYETPQAFQAPVDGIENRDCLTCHSKNPEFKQSLPHDKTVDRSKLKASADYKLKVAKMIFFVFDRVENIVEKRRKC